MRKHSILLAAAVFVICLNLSAQTKFGVNAGLSLAHMYAKYDGQSFHAKTKLGLIGGLVADISLNNRFSIQPGLQFIQKGFKYDESDVNYTYTDKLTLNYIEIPLNVIFRPEAGNIRFFVGGGPSVAFALSGKEVENDNGVKSEVNYKFGNSDQDDLKGFDFGANLISGLEMKNGLVFSVNYTFGLNNLMPGSAVDGSLKNNNFGFKLGYMFSKKK